MKPIILEAKELKKIYPQGKEMIPVLAGVDLTIYENDFTMIMGASGAGKSTLCYMLGGMDVPDGGTVSYRENRISHQKEKVLAKLRAQEFGFVFQQPNLVSNLTVFENVAVAGYLCKDRKTKDVDRDTRALLEKLKLTHVSNRLGCQISGGEAQRAAIARAVIKNPGILFADEPTGALNRTNSDNILHIFSELYEAGQTIVMVTHDVHAASYGNRILYMEDGRITGEFSLAEYKRTDNKEREHAITEWLEALHW